MNPPASNLPLVVLLGDSIRLGYETVVAESLAGVARVWSPAENGEDTSHTLARLDTWLVGKAPACIHLNCGLHDAFLSRDGICRHLADVYAANLRRIFERAGELAPRARLVFALTTPVDELRQMTSATYGRLVRRNADILRYNAGASAVARECGVTVHDLHGPIAARGTDFLLIDDGIHLSPAGAALAGGCVAEMIARVLTNPTES